MNSERKGHVVCLRVEGNRAIFGIELDKADPRDPNAFREFVVADNGNPTGGQPVDTITEASTTNTRPTCSRAPAGGRVLEHGNIQVHDS